MKLFNISDRKEFLDSWNIQAKTKREAIHLFCDYYNIKWQLYIDRLVIELLEDDTN